MQVPGAAQAPPYNMTFPTPTVSRRLIALSSAFKTFEPRHLGQLDMCEDISARLSQSTANALEQPTNAGLLQGLIEFLRRQPGHDQLQGAAIIEVTLHRTAQPDWLSYRLDATEAVTVAKAASFTARLRLQKERRNAARPGAAGTVDVASPQAQDPSATSPIMAFDADAAPGQEDAGDNEDAKDDMHEDADVEEDADGDESARDERLEYGHRWREEDGTVVWCPRKEFAGETLSTPGTKVGRINAILKVTYQPPAFLANPVVVHLLLLDRMCPVDHSTTNRWQQLVDKDPFFFMRIFDRTRLFVDRLVNLQDVRQGFGLYPGEVMRDGGDFQKLLLRHKPWFLVHMIDRMHGQGSE